MKLTAKEWLRRVLLYNERVSKEMQVPLGYLYKLVEKEDTLKINPKIG